MRSSRDPAAAISALRAELAWERAWGRTAWVPVYIIGISVISFLGDPHFTFQNFTPWEPLGILQMPHDLIVLTIFSTLIFAWAYRVNVRGRAA